MKQQLFHTMYCGYANQVYAYLLGRTSSKSEAEDLLHDVFLRIWNRIETVERIPEDQRLYWIFSIAANRAKDYYRNSASRKKMESRIQSEYQGISTGDLSSLLAVREQVDELETAIRGLPEELRYMLTMKAVGGMNSNEIGAALGMPAGTVRYKLSQARGLLARRLGLLESEDTLGRRATRE
ncbi:RNA polymerase sigma factor [Paenibacillus sp. R14(2021)]|uniref:RNA polymerase sigma factor n=1 Tax=Paenibacillus sp. R14(2021) TaxID=2859228 RepID=UPI001C612D30|nr:sigma-70 family RNA polymerase sigma factor [Paenibacillus sp. R14(2021)]